MANRPQPIRDPHAALVAARELIANPDRWTRSAPGRRWKAPQMREPGAWVPTHAWGPHASRWCAAAALCAVSGMRRDAPGIEYLETASFQLFGTDSKALVGRDEPQVVTSDSQQGNALWNRHVHFFGGVDNTAPATQPLDVGRQRGLTCHGQSHQVRV